MSTFLSTIPGAIGTIISLGAVMAVVVIGALYALGIWKKGKDDQDDRLIKILEGTIDALEKKVDDQKRGHDEIINELMAKIEVITKKVNLLESENGTLTKVLQGRDEQTQVFYKKAFESMEMATKTFLLVEAINKNHNDLMKMLVEHLKQPGVTINNQQPAQSVSNPPSLIVS